MPDTPQEKREAQHISEAIARIGEARTGNWILDEDGNPVREPDTLQWGKWFQDGGGRRVGNTKIREGVSVSTVFLGIDHNWGEGPPVLWETMIFVGKHDQDQDRYTSALDAIHGHWEMVMVASPWWIRVLYRLRIFKGPRWRR